MEELADRSWLKSIFAYAKNWNLTSGKTQTGVINWFEKIDERHLNKFTIFYIRDIYPSIKETLLKNAMQFSAKHKDINENDFECNI